MKQATEKVKVGTFDYETLKEKCQFIKRIVTDLGPERTLTGVRHGIITYRNEIVSIWTRDTLSYWTMYFEDVR